MVKGVRSWSDCDSRKMLAHPRGWGGHWRPDREIGKGGVVLNRLGSLSDNQERNVIRGDRRGDERALLTR
jgi:hypothetical protein